MNALIWIVGCVIVLYLAAKVILYLIRPYYIKKLEREIESWHSWVCNDIKRNLEYYLDNFKLVIEKDNFASLGLVSADAVVENMNRCIDRLNEQNDIYNNKYYRGKVRFFGQRNKYVDVVLAYHKYMRLKKFQTERWQAIYCIPTDAMMEESKQIIIALEESLAELDHILISE